MSKPFRLGIIADTHIGSRYALVPPGYIPEKAGPSRVYMEYMWACWQHFLKACPSLDCLVINGDSMEGEHPTLRCAPDAITTDELRQVDMAIETLGPLCDKAKKVWLVRGTGFHEGKWHNALESLGRELGAERWHDRRYSGEVLDGIFAGRSFNIVHAQTTGAIYPGTLMNRTAWFSRLAESLGKIHRADFIIRSHTHATGKGEYMGKWILSTRCWKLVNPYAIARMEYNRAQALLDLGGHVITFSDDGISFRDFSYEPYKVPALRNLA